MIGLYGAVLFIPPSTMGCLFYRLLWCAIQFVLSIPTILCLCHELIEHATGRIVLLFSFRMRSLVFRTLFLRYRICTVQLGTSHLSVCAMTNNFVSHVSQSASKSVNPPFLLPSFLPFLLEGEFSFLYFPPSLLLFNILITMNF